MFDIVASHRFSSIYFKNVWITGNKASHYNYIRIGNSKHEKRKNCIKFIIKKWSCPVFHTATKAVSIVWFWHFDMNLLKMRLHRNHLPTKSCLMLSRWKQPQKIQCIRSQHIYYFFSKGVRWFIVNLVKTIYGAISYC